MKMVVKNTLIISFLCLVALSCLIEARKYTKRSHAKLVKRGAIVKACQTKRSAFCGGESSIKIYRSSKESLKNSEFICYCQSSYLDSKQGADLYFQVHYKNAEDYKIENLLFDNEVQKNNFLKIDYTLDIGK